MDLSTAQVILASSGDGGDLFFVAALAFAAPFVVGWYAHRQMYKRYRNQDKRYRYEHTTDATMEDLQRWDTFTHERRRLRNRTIEGENANSPEVRAPYVDLKEMTGELDSGSAEENGGAQ
ncbi:hypothetical protein [Demequina sediminicola]|uniref:hypothetical protein n=1 Tax=Demequina sediminicola TaxID=1095026 RepID=UPI000781F66B|nr:hypothetical protein [Demequina sediminicola]